VWSVLSERLDLYLGSGLAMLKAGTTDPVVIHEPASLPLERMLSLLHEQAHKKIVKGSSFRIYLGACACPAVGVTTPKEVTRWQEQHQIAQASVAHSLDASMDQIACEIDTAQPGVAAAISTTQLDNIQQWVSELGGHVASIRPLWSVATQCTAACEANIKGLVLAEPGAVTLLASDGQGACSALTLQGKIDLAALAIQTRRWQVRHHLAENQILKLGFGPATGAALPASPKPWAGHWYQP
jgi:hypothetical protein